MEVMEQRRGEAVVFKPRGPLVGEDADALGRRLAKALGQNFRVVVLDASEVPFVDSRGLEVLLDATEQLIRSGQALKVAAANDRLREVLELTGLASLFEQFHRVDEALGAPA